MCKAAVADMGCMGRGRITECNLDEDGGSVKLYVSVGSATCGLPQPDDAARLVDSVLG